ncbi:Dyp-type peroxidase [Streptomyces sp. M10(2022)]
MTARNLMGQIDGTGNPKPGENDFDQRIFVPPGTTPGSSAGSPGASGPAYEWMAGGSYAVVRRIRMLLDDWEKLSVERQERVIGRHKRDGARSAAAPRPPGWTWRGRAGRQATDPRQRARPHLLPEKNGGAAMLRRPFSYHDGIADDGTPDAGLLFICWQADPYRGFVPVQRKLDRGDALAVHPARGKWPLRGAGRRGPGSTWGSGYWSRESVPALSYGPLG